MPASASGNQTVHSSLWLGCGLPTSPVCCAVGSSTALGAAQRRTIALGKDALLLA